MSAEDELTTAIRSLIGAMVPSHPIRRGAIVQAVASGTSFQVTVDLGYQLVVGPDGLSGPFVTELRAALVSSTGLQSLAGRKVEVHFSEGQQAAIAYTVGV